jgi:hypothetical protein
LNGADWRFTLLRLAGKFRRESQTLWPGIWPAVRVPEKKSGTDRDQSVAVHEATHFVIGFVLATGNKHSVTIEPAGDIEGEVSGEFPNEPDDGAVELLVLRGLG